MKQRHRWTPADDALLVAQYDGTTASRDALTAKIGVTRTALGGRIQKLQLAKRHLRRWSQADLDWLHDHWGTVSDEAVCEHLGRTRAACSLAVKRHLHIQRKMNFYTALELARIFGLKEARDISRTWIEKGFIKARKSTVRCGRNLMWYFTEAEVERCLRRRPWLVDLRWAEDHHHFCSIVRAEFERDPWYTCAEAAPLLGVTGADPVHRWIAGGLLKAEKKPGGPWQVKWIIRRSAIEALLTNDTRKQLRRARMLASRRECNYRKGKAAMVARLWHMRCPHCRQTVRILSAVRATNADVGSWFLETYRGACTHRAEVYMKEVQWMNPTSQMAEEIPQPTPDTR